jgi:hypothetical protein
MTTFCIAFYESYLSTVWPDWYVGALNWGEVSICLPPQHAYTVKKSWPFFPSPAGISLTKLSLGGTKLNYSCPGRVWSVTSRLGTGKRPTPFYSVYINIQHSLNFSIISLSPIATHSPHLLTEFYQTLFGQINNMRPKFHLVYIRNPHIF